MLLLVWDILFCLSILRNGSSSSTLCWNFSVLLDYGNIAWRVERWFVTSLRPSRSLDCRMQLITSRLYQQGTNWSWCPGSEWVWHCMICDANLSWCWMYESCCFVMYYHTMMVHSNDVLEYLLNYLIMSTVDSTLAYRSVECYTGWGGSGLGNWATLKCHVLSATLWLEHYRFDTGWVLCQIAF